MSSALAPAALFAATHPSRTTALVVLDAYAAPLEGRTDGLVAEEGVAAFLATWATGEWWRAINPDMPWNEEIRVAWARHDRLAASPGTVALMLPLVRGLDVRAVLPTIRVPTLVVHHTDDPFVPPVWGKYVADHISGAKYVELPGRNVVHIVEPWRPSFQEIYEFLTGQQAEVADDRVLATVLFTDIVDSTRRAAEMGDRDWHALLDAHDAVVRSQLSRFRGREVNTSGDGFLAMFDGPQRATSVVPLLAHDGLEFPYRGDAVMLPCRFPSWVKKRNAPEHQRFRRRRQSLAPRSLAVSACIRPLRGV
jgi:hypothetical protein